MGLNAKFYHNAMYFIISLGIEHLQNLVSEAMHWPVMIKLTHSSFLVFRCYDYKRIITFFYFFSILNVNLKCAIKN